jgi:tetratricopeptide (TPR) repeat protein
MPLADVLSALANFLRGRSLRETQLAEVLLDSRRSLAERADILAQNTSHDRFLFVFDNLETALTPGPSPFKGEGSRSEGEIRTFADPEWQEFFAAVFRQNWRFTWLFTSRFRLDLLDQVPRANRLELHLPGLNRRQAIMFMNNLPRLSKEPLADKLAAFDRIGGHPKTIELLDGWLAPPPTPVAGGGGPGWGLRALLDDPATATRLAEEWEGYFLGELLGRLTEPERRVLEAVSVFQVPFWWRMVEWMTLPSPSQGEGLGVRVLARWHDLSLVQLEGVDRDGDAWYALHPVVREYLWGRLAEAEQEQLHLRAAEWYREQILGPYWEQLPPIPPEEEQEAATTVLYQLAKQTQDMARARWAVQTGLLWRSHLFAARRWEDAGAIITALWLVLDRWGQRDLTKSLLRESIATREGGNKAVAQGNLATLLVDEGRLDEALATYEEVYHTFEELGAKTNMAVALGQISLVYQHKGDYDRAIERQQASLDIRQEIGDEEGQAISLHQLSIIYHLKEDYPRALETSRQAEALARKVGSEAHVATTLHQQGIILTKTNQPAEAFARFQESLAIFRRIGHEAGAAGSLGEIGKLLMAAGQMAEAIAAFTECLDIDRRLNNPANMGIDLSMLGEVHERQGQYVAALEKYEQAKRLYRQYAPPNISIIEQKIARVRGKMG